MNYYLAHDSETGGIGNDKSLLTAYFGVFDRYFNLVDELDLKLKPDDGIYKVTGQALDINKINLVEHDKVAMSYKEGGSALYRFLNENYKLHGQLTPVGHNGHFDVNMYQTHLVSRGSWEQFVSYRMIDTMTVARFLQDIRVLSPELGISLGNLIKTLDIQVVGNPHEAKYDALATMRVYQKLKELV